MSSTVACGLPIFAPFALAFAIPDFTRSRMIRSSNSANTPDIWINAFVMGSIWPLAQSTVMLPTMTSRRCLERMISMISHNCLVERARRETSSVIIVSPSCACSKREDSWHFTAASPCSYSRKTRSAPACFSSRTCLSMSCLLSLVEHLAYPYFIIVFPFGWLHGLCTARGALLFQQEMEKRRLALCFVKAL